MFDDDAQEDLPRAPLCSLAGLIRTLLADGATRHAAYQAGQARGPLTGLPALDTLLGGALEPGLHILHGSPGCGKSALALSLAARCGCPRCSSPPS
jgi:replicative DNA helicase